MRINRRGLTLIEALVTCAMVMGIILGVTPIFRGARNGETAVAVNNGFSQLTATLHLILGSQSACQKSGLLGLTINPAAPGATVLTLRTPGPIATSTAIATGLPFSPLQVTSLTIPSMVAAGLSGGGNAIYFTTIRLVAQPNSSQVVTTRNLTRDFYVELILDAANTVLSCYGAPGQTQIISGVVPTYFSNGSPHSLPGSVTFPYSCLNPVVVTNTLSDSIACSDAAGLLAACSNDPASRSQDISSYVETLSSSGFTTIISGNSAACVAINGSLPAGTVCPGISPPYNVSYVAVCNP